MLVYRLEGTVSHTDTNQDFKASYSTVETCADRNGGLQHCSCKPPTVLQLQACSYSAASLSALHCFCSLASRLGLASFVLACCLCRCLLRAEVVLATSPCLFHALSVHLRLVNSVDSRISGINICSLFAS